MPENRRDKEEEVTVDNLAGGGAAEMFAAAMLEVAENMQDPNTSELAKRRITLTVELKPTSRDHAIAIINVQTKLAPQKNVTTPIYFGKQNGRAIAVGMDMRQGNLFDKGSADVVPMEKTRRSQEN